MFRCAFFSIFAALFAVSSVCAQSVDDKIQQLRKVVEHVRSSDGDITLKSRNSAAGESAQVQTVSREGALRSLYTDLAALEYHKAIQAGLPTDGEQKARQSLDNLKSRTAFAQDVEAVKVDVSQLSESGCWTCHCVILLGCQYCCTAVAAVRGGRKIDQGLDKKLNSLDASLAAANPLESGRIYEKMADVADSTLVPAMSAPVQQLSPKQIYQQDGPAVVLIICSDPSGTGELGSGSIIDDKGHVLTNAHVVVRGSTEAPWDKIRVYLKPAKVTGDAKVDLRDPISARVVRFDRKLDLALLELETAPQAGILPLGDSDAVSAGDPVVAIGHPEQGGLWTLTTGIVSTVVANLGGVEGKDVFQTDASINRGNSGGPLIARDGRMIGVNTSMARKAADGLTITSVNFSVKSDVVKRWLKEEGIALQAQAPAAPAAPSAPAVVVPPPSVPVVAAPPPAAPAPAAPVVSAPPQPLAPPVVAEVKTPPSKPAIVTPAKPYKIKSLIDQEIQEMEDMGKEMEAEIQRRRMQP